MTKEDLIVRWWPFIEHTILEGVRLYLAGDEPKKFATPEMLFDEVPMPVKRFLCATYNEIMAKVIHKDLFGQDELYVQLPHGAQKKFSREMKLEEMREKIQLPKGVIPDAVRREQGHRAE